MKKLFLGALAMLSMGAVATQSTTPNPQNNVRYDKRNQNRDSQPIQSQKQISQRITKENSKGYSGRLFRNDGIPPKIYGMYYVKRGTHKRTNI